MQEVVNLRRSWESPVPELGTSVFVIPRSFVKNGQDRYVVLNRMAGSVIDSCRGEHPEFVFICEGRPVTKVYNSGWKAARRRAAKRYAGELGSPCPDGFRSVRVHDLTRLAIARAWRASGLKTASSSSATNPNTSPRTTRRPRSGR
jgi:hypothetical protein